MIIGEKNSAFFSQFSLFFVKYRDEKPKNFFVQVVKKNKLVQIK